MISRTAERCFRSYRELERAGTLARVLGLNLALEHELPVPGVERWQPLRQLAGAQLRAAGTAGGEDAEEVQRLLTWERANPDSLASSISGAHERARPIRELLGASSWTTLDTLAQWLDDRATRRLYERERPAFYAHVREQCLLFDAHARDTVVREEPFAFMRLGRALERAVQTTRIVDLKHHGLAASADGRETPEEIALWLAVLRFCSASDVFFKGRAQVLSGAEVAAFLLLDRAFPGSVRHNLERARGLLENLRSDGVGAQSAARLAELVEWLDADDTAAALRRGLQAGLARLTSSLEEVGHVVARDYFGTG